MRARCTLRPSIVMPPGTSFLISRSIDVLSSLIVPPRSGFVVRPEIFVVDSDPTGCAYGWRRRVASASTKPWAA